MEDNELTTLNTRDKFAKFWLYLRAVTRSRNVLTVAEDLRCVRLNFLKRSRRNTSAVQLFKHRAASLREASDLFDFENCTERDLRYANAVADITGKDFQIAGLSGFPNLC